VSYDSTKSPSKPDHVEESPEEEPMKEAPKPQAVNTRRFNSGNRIKPLRQSKKSLDMPRQIDDIKHRLKLASTESESVQSSEVEKRKTKKVVKTFDYD
jgi:hypothetical protein